MRYFKKKSKMKLKFPPPTIWETPFGKNRPRFDKKDIDGETIESLLSLGERISKEIKKFNDSKKKEL